MNQLMENEKQIKYFCVWSVKAPVMPYCWGYMGRSHATEISVHVERHSKVAIQNYSTTAAAIPS
jgi:ribosome biogenesis protein Nip4